MHAQSLFEQLFPGEPWLASGLGLLLPQVLQEVSSWDRDATHVTQLALSKH